MRILNLVRDAGLSHGLIITIRIPYGCKSKKGMYKEEHGQRILNQSRGSPTHVSTKI
jgi:hypothetical protein